MHDNLDGSRSAVDAPQAVIVAAARTPIGRAFKGSLTSVRADDLCAAAVQAAMAQVPQLGPGDLDDLMVGCGAPGGDQGFNMARVIALLLRWDLVPGTKDRPKIWAHSGDSHLMEPEDIWTSRLPKDLADRAPRTERGEKYEIACVDGKQVTRQLNDFMDAMRPPGFKDLKIRLRDMDQEGVRCQLAFPSSGFWTVEIEDPALAQPVARAWNEWAIEDFMGQQNRILAPAVLPLPEPADAVKELEWAAERGFQAVFLPTGTPEGREWGLEMWNPLWDAAAAHDMVLAFHIGTGTATVVYRGPGGAVVNYMETTYPGMRVVSQLVASGALDRHPDLKMLVAEGGAGWVPAIGDRMDEAYRQHGMFVRPRLDRLPSEIVRSQVYTSFQHDISAVQVIEDTNYYNVMWGDDYPHLEGTYGHTQDTLHQVFDGVDARIKDRVLRGTFEELFTVPATEDLTVAS